LTAADASRILAVMRFLKVLLVLLIVVAALGAGAVVGVRASRSRVSELGEVHPGLVGVTNAVGISLFAARLAPGPHVILFDTGLDPEGRPVDALLAALGAGRADVSDIFLTNGHADHVSGVPALPKARVHLGAADVPVATGKQPAEALLPMLMGKALQTAPIAVSAPITAAGPIPVDGAAGAKTVKAFPVPGHTPGSFVFLYDGVLIAGDIMVYKQGRLEPPPRVFDPNPDQNKAAIRSLKQQLADETVEVVCTAHGGCTPKGLGRNLLDDLITRI
jgi:glyoxylase-like metal-dependent hydrolase (beta-lactamase superfamily II)